MDGLLNIGVIQPSSSEWASPPVLIRKKDGKVRWCIDYCALNNATIKDAFPLPNISECLDVLGDTMFFSTLDMSSGYYQIPIREEDRDKTAFLTKYGLFEHCRMPFGLCNAPATFQRAMMLVLKGLTWKEVLAYLDDIMILGKSFEDHLNNIIEVFKRFRDRNLKLRAKKCLLFQTEVGFLGKRVSKSGIAVNPDSMETIQNWPIPTDVKEVQRILGMANYHRAHIKDFSHIASPLHGLTKKGVKFEWTNEHQVAFDLLKKALLSSPVLSFPRNSGEPFILDTDASGVAIGAELLQVQDGQEKVISYGSYSLTPAQRNYCTTRKELLAMVRFTRQFRHYLLGRQFYVRTDHNCMTWLMGFKYPTGLLARWLEELSQFDMVVIHRKGIDHGNADALSRIPDKLEYCNFYSPEKALEELPCFPGCKFCERAYRQWSRFGIEVDDVIPLSLSKVPSYQSVRSVRHMLGSEETCDGKGLGETVRPVRRVLGCESPQESLGHSEWIPLPFVRPLALSETQDDDGVHLDRVHTLADIRSAQLKDPDIRDLLIWTESGQQPTQAELQLSSPAVKHFWRSFSLLSVAGGVLYYRWVSELSERLLLIVPDGLKAEVLRLSHDIKLTGHPGVARTLFCLRERYIWYGLRKDCEIYVRACPRCSREKKASKAARGALGVYHAGAPMERLHIDILGPFPKSSKGNRYILMVICQFTKWLEAYPIADQTAEQVAKVVVDNFISRFGIPTMIHTDQGANFTSALFHSVCDLLEIVKTRTSPYRPCSNGQVERYNRTLLQLIRCHLKSSDKWDEDLPLLTSAIRSLPNRQTGFSPNFLMLGREVTHLADLLVPESGSVGDERLGYAENLRSRLRKAHALVREHLQVSQKRQKDQYDLQLRQTKYQLGDVVLRRNDSSKKGHSNKLKPSWKGPFLIVEVLSLVLFRVRGPRKTKILHHDLIKKCHDVELPMWLRWARHKVEEGCLQADSGGDVPWGLNWLFREDPVMTGFDSLNQGSESVVSQAEVAEDDPAVAGSSLELSQEAEVAEDDPAVAGSSVDIKYTWVQCENPHCLKWRKITLEEEGRLGEEPWYCSLNQDLKFSSCDKEEEECESWLDNLEREGLKYNIKDSARTNNQTDVAITRHGRKTKKPARYCEH